MLTKLLVSLLKQIITDFVAFVPHIVVKLYKKYLFYLPQPANSVEGAEYSSRSLHGAYGYLRGFPSLDLWFQLKLNNDLFIFKYF